MSKFGKKKKEMPAVNTASLPDIVFMLLFFFMVSTTMRETDLLIEAPTLANATEIKKLKRKSLVSTIYVGKAKDPSKYGSGDKIQLNDKISSVQEVANFIYSEREGKSDSEIGQMTTSIKADKKCSVGTVYDIKQELREINALKVSYSTNSGGDLSLNLK